MRFFIIAKLVVTLNTEIATMLAVHDLYFLWERGTDRLRY